MPIQTPDRFMQANNIVKIGVAKTGVTIDSTMKAKIFGFLTHLNLPAINSPIICINIANEYT